MASRDWHKPDSASQTSGAAMLIAEGPSTTTEPSCTPAQFGSVPSHGNGSALPSTLISCDSPTVKLPPSATDTAVMSPLVLRNTAPVTVAAAPDSTVSGTVEPSPYNSALEIASVPALPASPEMLSGESVSTHPLPTVVVPKLTLTTVPSSVPPERASEAAAPVPVI
eukprot:SAG22_NODE_15_length_32914_cov_20.713546_16_plen_167_part_00